MFLTNLRGEFIAYLDKHYPNMSFNVSFPTFNFINNNFVSKVTCLELGNGAFFTIQKNSRTKVISENYEESKSQIQYNNKLNSIFKGSDVQGSIRRITGGSKAPFEDDAVYENIYIHLNDSAEYSTVIRKILHILKEQNISAEEILFVYEKNKEVYQLVYSSDDYNDTENEIESEVKKIK